MAKLKKFGMMAGAAVLLASTLPARAEVGPDAIRQRASVGVLQGERISEWSVDGFAVAAKSASVEESYGITVLETKTGPSTIADLSLAGAEDARDRALWAASSEGVQLSWGSDATVREYRVSRDGELLSVVTGSSYFDGSATPGSEATYLVQAVPKEDVEGEGRTWSLNVPVPKSSGSDLSALKQEAEQTAAAVAAIDKSSVTYKTFIPQQYLSAPPVGCGSYSGSAYSFGGDNRTWSQTSTAYRTRQIVSVNWLSSASLETSNVNGATKVYRTSNKQLISTKTASNSGMSIRKLAGSTTAKADLRFTLDSTNPFCTGIPNSISAVFTMIVTRSGNWSITSGSHKQMPNHEIYMGRHTAGYPRYTTAYRRAYLSPQCLVAVNCRRANMGGFSGTY
ncbi:hypothetical protein [Kribbella sp. CA-293567]|uniref:hypothetical protein n=1 Tax=Kribbella sp. CA-293567 TaxID=3002436 RepID=UPI0022DD45C3|nr:hypothetical protein [Kribbella sp. CA-293567]WBQ07362.1 hypothetical protein OX958_11290 [Kribbella sp. CA-293567]